MIGWSAGLLNHLKGGSEVVNQDRAGQQGARRRQGICIYLDEVQQPLSYGDRKLTEMDRIRDA